MEELVRKLKASRKAEINGGAKSTSNNFNKASDEDVDSMTTQKRKEGEKMETDSLATKNEERTDGSNDSLKINKCKEELKDDSMATKNQEKEKNSLTIITW